MVGVTVLATSGAFLWLAKGAANASVPCPAVLVIDSRGSGESVGTISRPGARLADALPSLLAPQSVERLANPYPARGGFSILAGSKLHVPGAYFHSVKSGETWLAAEIRKKARDCPDTRIVLTGYSQGAQVTGDVLQHHGPFSNVAAAVLFGDPYFNGRDPVDRGHPRYRTGVDGGLGKRPRFTGRHVLSYCDSNDPVCQRSANPIDLFTWHDNYDKLGEPADAAHTVARWLGSVTPNATERRAIRLAMRRQWDADYATCGPNEIPQPFAFSQAVIAAANRLFAIGYLRNESGPCHVMAYVFRRSGRHREDWKLIIRIPDSFQPCSLFTKALPESVVQDFALEGAPASGVGITRC